MLYSLLPIILSILLLSTLVSGVVILLGYAERSPQRNMLIGVFCIKIPLMILMLYRQIEHFPTGVSGYMSNEMAFGGMISFFSLILYGASVLFSMRFRYKQIFAFLLPVILVLVASITINTLYDLPIYHLYPSMDIMVSNISSPVTIVRIAMLVTQFVYLSFLVFAVANVVPLYNDYVQHTESEERYNLHWLYAFIIVLCFEAAAYFTFAVVANYTTQVLYSIVTIGCVFMLIDMGRIYKFFPHVDEFQLRWSFKDRWVRVDTLSQELQSESGVDSLSDSRIDEIKRWIVETKQYASPKFSMKDIVEHYPDTYTVSLINTFRNQHTTFQHFVRDVRIGEAERMLKDKNRTLSNKEICFKVGFSHYSSFSRAFTSVTGKSPSKYEEEEQVASFK